VTAYSSADCDKTAAAGETLLQRFHRYFAVVEANTPERLRQAQHIRYQVYCVENAFEDAAEHEDGRECDAYDAHAVHSLLIERSSNEAVGTVRLILPRLEILDDSFSLQHLVPSGLLASQEWFPLHTTAEVSRFSISKQVRRRKTDTLYGQDTPPTSTDRRDTPLMRLGLIQALVRMSRDHGVTHWCAVMEPALLRMLAAMGIYFKPLGPLVEYHGLRQPCFCAVDDILNSVKRKRPEFWTVLTDDGALCTTAHQRTA
jgi:N-acyl amino acid synthase of PEP-CTERM/exosortase system